MKKLLVAVDGSDAALRALRVATDLARLVPGASLHLVHAHEEPRIYGELAVYVPREKMQALQRAQCEAFLDRAEGDGPPRQSALGDILMGSVAMKVLHASRLPVILVR